MQTNDPGPKHHRTLALSGSLFDGPEYLLKVSYSAIPQDASSGPTGQPSASWDSP